MIFLLNIPRHPGESDTVDSDEADDVIVAIAKTVAETRISQQDRHDPGSN